MEQKSEKQKKNWKKGEKYTWFTTGEKSKVNLLLKLEGFVWVHEETPSNFRKPHYDRQLKPIEK